LSTLTRFGELSSGSYYQSVGRILLDSLLCSILRPQTGLGQMSAFCSSLPPWIAGSQGGTMTDTMKSAVRKFHKSVDVDQVPMSASHADSNKVVRHPAWCD